MAQAFKEWSLVCEALASGRQTLLLRKGGIAEGREGFSFRETDFFLFPTYYHGQIESLRLPEGAVLPPAPGDGWIGIALRAHVAAAGVLTNFEAVQRLSPFHIWKESVVEQRFRYGGADALHYAVVRIWRLTPEWRLADRASYGGCRSWVELPEPPAETLYEPVLADEDFARRTETLRGMLESNAAKL